MDHGEDFYNSVGVSRLHDHDFFRPEDVEEGERVFIKTDYIYNGYFQNYILPKISSKFILVSGISSYHVGSNGASSYSDILESPKLIKWYCTNPPDCESEKIVPLPIGFEEREREGGNQELISKCRKNRTKFKNKKDKVLLPHHTLNTNPQRAELFAMLANLDFVEVQRDKLSWPEYMAMLDKYKYVICLEGSGPDVHRNYECLLVDSIPINIDNTIRSLFEHYNLPGVFIEDWGDLDTSAFDNTKYSFDNVDKFLKIKYHSDLIRGER
jgi:hypothetical protein